MSKKDVKITPLSDRVLIKELDEKKGETKTKFGIIIPSTTNDDRSTKKGEVISTGPGRHEEGKIIPVAVKKGDIVLFSWGDKVKIDDEEYFIVREPEIIGIVK